MKSKSERQEAMNGGRVRVMGFMVVLVCLFLMSCWVTSEATTLITGQRVCRIGPGRPCYKLAYFSDFRRRLNFEEAEQACKRDGGKLLSVESPSEQRIIEELITELRPSDGDFWIGLRRDHRDEDNNAECSAEYYWVDGSESTFRNWHWDEPSCGYEVCVVMYHQPSASAGLGEMYMFQWNDDNCETKNNFICKYTTERSLDPFSSSNVTAPAVALPTPLQPQDPNNHGDKEKIIVLNWMHILLPTVPLVLLSLTLVAVCCFRLCGRRRKRQHQKSEVCQTEPTFPPPSPAPDDVYNVIRSQKDDDLAETRPQTKNTSFLCSSSPDTPTGDYDNLPGRDTESGFVTLASTESCFLSLDLNDLSLGRRGNRDLYDNSLGRSGKRDINDGSLGRYGNHRESYDRSLGRRTGRSELYAGWERETDEERGSLAWRSDLYEPSYDPARPTLKADLYQTYLSNGRKDLYQTNMVPYANRKSYHGYYNNEPNLSSTRYYNEADWVNSNGY